MVKIKLSELFENKKFLVILIIVNILAAIFTIRYYYLNQLLENHPLLWIFIADCPVFAFLFSFILYKKIKKQDCPLLTFITLAGVVKFSLWTFFVMFLTTNAFNYPEIILSHILFLLQIIIFYKTNLFKIKYILIGLIVFLISDFFDYVLLTHPPINLNYFNEIALFSIFLTFFSIFFVSIFFSKK